MKQYTENQYDDDLTVGTDDYDDSYYTGSVDLFEFSNDEETPISRLKSLILSIDWEITDEILMQFNEELVDLRDIWAGEKINLIYVQALEKISKYIYQKKADSHPGAIKLLLTLYHNLEKIVSSFDLTEEQKKAILLEDVKRFESLKRYIDKQAQTVGDSKNDQLKLQKQSENSSTGDELLDLKAIVLGIDWEITDQDLDELRLEVVRLEEKFADSRPRLILLQGIGKLGAYIKLRKSNAHADAFKILHLFYDCLEKIVTTPMKLEEEKAVLFPAIEKFNSFKILLGPAISSETIIRNDKDIDEDDSPDNPVAIAPAFADIPEEEIMGFQAEEEAKALGLESSGNVDNHVESFFLGNSSQNQEPHNHDAGPRTLNGNNQEIALQGVNVEEDGDEVDKGVSSESDLLAPALSSTIEKNRDDGLPSTLQGQEFPPAEDEVVATGTSGGRLEEFSEALAEIDFPNEDEDKSGHDFSKLDKEFALQGVDVETEADDDSDEEALPMMDGVLAPALAENDEVSIYNADKFDNSSELKPLDDEIAGTLGGFFDEEIESHSSVAAKVDEEDVEVASVTVEPENDERKINALADSSVSFDSEETTVIDHKDDGEIEGDDSSLPLMANAISSEEEPVTSVEESSDSSMPETELEEDGAIAFLSELEQEKNLDLFFDDSDFEQSAERILENNQDEVPTEIDAQLDSFFDLGKDAEEPEADKHCTLPEETSKNNVTFEKDVSPSVFENIEEEEVVFELAEEEDEFSDTGSGIGKNGATAFSELFSSEEDISSLALATEDESVEEFPENITPALEIDKSADSYEFLRTCVDSLGIELDDKVISGLLGEIERLDQELREKPLEKMFLQLLSTVTRHIDQNRYDSSNDAYVLLQSVCGALTGLHGEDLHQNLEMLLVETHNVLEWQEKMLAEQAARNEAELTIGDSIQTDQESVQGDFDELIQNYSEDQVLESFDNDELNNSTVNRQNARVEETTGKVFAQSELEDPMRLLEAQEQHAAGEGTDILTDDLKQEISTLRQSLQDEIEELRNELKSDYP